MRSFTPGHSFALRNSPLDLLPALGTGHSERDRQFLITQVVHAGINNLPKVNSAQAAQTLPAWVPEPVRAQATSSGYGNGFEALRATVPWRPWRWDDTGAQFNPRPLAPGLQTATVVGPQGETSLPHEIHTDRLGRVRVRFGWQDGGHASGETSRSSSWVRVVQRWAGSNHSPGAQGNTVAGHNPAWHGAGAGEASEGAQAQNNAAALSGVKAQEVAGSGHNQLVFDDSDAQPAEGEQHPSRAGPAGLDARARARAGCCRSAAMSRVKLHRRAAPASADSFCRTPP